MWYELNFEYSNIAWVWCPYGCCIVAGWMPTCDSAHLWWIYDVVPLGDKISSTMNWYPTQSHYPESDPIRPCSILIIHNMIWDYRYMLFIDQNADAVTSMIILGRFCVCKTEWEPNECRAAWVTRAGVRCCWQWMQRRRAGGRSQGTGSDISGSLGTPRWWHQLP